MPGPAEPRVEAPVDGCRQLPLDLPLPDARGREDFLPSGCNLQAYETLLGWRHWPQPACVLVGPHGSGRSHLAHIFAAETGATYLRGPDLDRMEDPLRELGERAALVVDDADRATEWRRLLECYNLIAQRRGRMLFTALSAPAGWGIALPDLRSRLEAALQVAISPPDDGLLAALLVKQFADRQIRVEPGVVQYLVSHMERSFAAARGIVRLLDRLSLATRRAVTMSLARRALAGPSEEEATRDGA